MGNWSEFGERQLLLASGLLFAKAISYRKNLVDVFYSV